MKRRQFLGTIGVTSIGAGTLVGTGSFSRVESQRRMEIEVGPRPDDETAWAVDRDNERPLNELDDITKWGWYIEYDVSEYDDERPLEAEFWAGAGGNDFDAGHKIGRVDIWDDGETLSVKIEITDDDWELVNSHLYVDRDTDRLNDVGAAPGRLNHEDPDGSYEIDLEEEGLDEEDKLIIAVHGVVEGP